jgi:hypothetical protein
MKPQYQKNTFMPLKKFESPEYTVDVEALLGDHTKVLEKIDKVLETYSGGKGAEDGCYDLGLTHSHAQLSQHGCKVTASRTINLGS